ncbi:MAG: Fe-S-containing hydro-lyase [Lachnospiraceae bacterium]|nr:Fe-S-containing hydro-lyase [Lachnospiraceae bacterium]
MKELYIDICDLKDEIPDLLIGDMVYLTGEIYTARDAAHKRMYEALEEGRELPFDIKGQIIYYMGPSPARPGNVIGSAGPTTSSRMDKYTPALLDLGLLCMIGKGRRAEEVKKAVVRNKAVYLAAIGGAGALLSKCISHAEVVAYEDLGTEAVRRLIVKNFPAVVALDTLGGDIYQEVENRV